MRRIPALDSLRAVAIAMVIAYHVDRDLVPAGFWGVYLFFVLSGFLTTRLLTSEVDDRGRVRFTRFYRRRFARIFPGLLLVVAAALVLSGVSWISTAATLLFATNYARIAGLEPGLLTHAWFLAVIGHFFVLWPLVIAATPAGRRRQVIGGLLALALAWRVAAIFVLSPEWVYNATDTNAAALLAGCLLAVARPARRRLAGWSLPALLALIFVPFFGEGDALLWGGFLAIGLSIAAVHYATTRPAWLEHPALLWFGGISYGLYLWHYVLLRSDTAAWVVAPLTLATAVASWYLVEKPVRRFVRRVDRRSTETDGAEEFADAGAGHRDS